MIPLRSLSHSLPPIHWRWLNTLAVIGLILRLGLAWGSEQIHHPDEIFQYLEQAHRLVFDYGYIPWEYRFGLRSWLLPSWIAASLYLCKLLHWDQPYIYIPLVKTLACIGSLSVIYSAYFVGRNLSSERSGQLASLFTCCWYELIYVAPRITPEVVSTYFFVIALAIATRRSPHPRTPTTWLWGLLWGASSGLAVALRLQYAPPLAVMLVLVLWQRLDLIRNGGLAGLGIVFLGVGWLDNVTWGEPFRSYSQNYLFNKTYGVSSLFGVQPFYYFLETLTYTSGGLWIGMLGFIKPVIDRGWLLLACAGSIVLSHSWIPHKEHRFIILAIPLLLTVMSIVLDHYGSPGLTSEPRSSNTRPRPRIWNPRRILTPLQGIGTTSPVILLVLIIGLGGIVLPPAQKVYQPYDRSPLVGQLYSLITRQPILDSYRILSQEPDLRGILNLAHPWFETGGYYYLHRDVPIYFAEHQSLWTRAALADYVSHVICRTDCPQDLGFQLWQRVGDLQIWRATASPPVSKTLNLDLKNVLQPGVDDLYQPPF